MTHFTRKPYELGSRISAEPLGPSREPGEFAESSTWRETGASKKSSRFECSLGEIAGDLGVTTERVRQIEARALDGFKRKLLFLTLTPAERAAGFTLWDVYGPES